MKERLLEDLSAQMQCFISSLPSVMNQVSALDALYGMPRERYDLEEWQYCLGYLFRADLNLSDREELEQFLFQKCVRKDSDGSN